MENYDRTVHEVQSPNGDPHPSRLTYSADVGKTLATIEGSAVDYQLTGKELYIRAVVTATNPHFNSSFANQTEAAWTQPVGWEKR